MTFFLLLLVFVTLSEKYGGVLLTNRSCIIFPGAYFSIPASTENLNNLETGRSGNEKIRPWLRYLASVVWHLSLPLKNSFNKTEADIHNLCYYHASRGRSSFLRLIMSSYFVLKVNTQQNKTYSVLFSLSLFRFTMALKCTYVRVAKQNFRGSTLLTASHRWQCSSTVVQQYTATLLTANFTNPVICRFPIQINFTLAAFKIFKFRKVYT